MFCKTIRAVEHVSLARCHLGLNYEIRYRLSCHWVTSEWWSGPQAWHCYLIISEWWSQLYAQATAKEQLKLCKGTEVEAKIYFGQNFTAAQRKELGCSYNPLTKKNNLSIHDC